MGKCYMNKRNYKHLLSYKVGKDLLTFGFLHFLLNAAMCLEVQSPNSAFATFTQC